MKLHLDNNIVEGTPEELVTYQELLKERGLTKDSGKSLFHFGHEHQRVEREARDTFQGLLGSLKLDKSSIGATESSTDEEETASTDIKVGDRVKVLDSKHGAEGEATVTAVLIGGAVELAGTNKNGMYLTDWANHMSNLEKIEDAPMGYTFWYIDGGVLNHLNVLKVSLEGYFEDSKGRRYTYQAVSGLVKPIDRVDVREKFEKARHSGQLLRYYPTVDVLIREH